MTLISTGSFCVAEFSYWQLESHDECWLRIRGKHISMIFLVKIGTYVRHLRLGLTIERTTKWVVMKRRLGTMIPAKITLETKTMLAKITLKRKMKLITVRVKSPWLSQKAVLIILSPDNDSTIQLRPVAGLKRKRLEGDVGDKHRRRNHGGGGGDGNGNGGDPAYLWTPDCNRGSQAFEEALGQHAANIVSRAHAPEENPDVHEDMEALENARETHIVAEHQTLSPHDHAILVRIANVCKDVMTQKQSGPLLGATEILQMLEQSNADSPNPVWDVNDAFRENSLLSIALRCCRATNLVNTAKFILLLNLMHFRCKVERCVSV
jgi:hypothetical protein